MANVLVDEDALISIAEGLRRARGATKIIYVPTEIPVPLTKYSGTPNATGFDEYSGGYGNSKSYLDTVTIPGAAKLQVKVQYQTESTQYDYLYIVKGTVTSIPSSGTKYGGNTKTTKELEFDGDTITFCFKSDSSNDSYLGYYAEIGGLDANGNVIGTGETTIVDVPTEVPNTFRVCDMALAHNESIYQMGISESGLNESRFNFTATATGSLT